jgi:hypothetical protein
MFVHGGQLFRQLGPHKIDDILHDVPGLDDWYSTQGFSSVNPQGR